MHFRGPLKPKQAIRQRCLFNDLRFSSGFLHPNPAEPTANRFTCRRLAVTIEYSVPIVDESKFMVFAHGGGASSAPRCIWIRGNASQLPLAATATLQRPF